MSTTAAVEKAKELIWASEVSLLRERLFLTSYHNKTHRELNNMNKLIEEYLEGIKSAIVDRAIEILDAEIKRTWEAVEKFEEENPTMKIPREGNVLNAGYSEKVRGAIRGSGTVIDATAQNIADSQVEKAINERLIPLEV